MRAPMDVSSPDVWRGLAAQARIVAHTLHDPGLRAELFSIASRYEVMAYRAEAIKRGELVATNSNERC